MEVQYWFCGQLFSCVVRVVKKFFMLYYNFQFSCNAFSRNIKIFVSGFPVCLSPAFLYVCLSFTYVFGFSVHLSPVFLSFVCLYICLWFSCSRIFCISIYGFPVNSVSCFPLYLCSAFLYICLRFSCFSVFSWTPTLVYSQKEKLC